MTVANLATAPQIAEYDNRIFDGFTEIAHQLSLPRRSLEETFLAMGGRLAGCVGLLSDISAAHEQMTATLCSEEFATTVAQLERVRIAAARLEHQSFVENLHTVIASVKPAVMSLAQSVRVIGFVSVNARIQAADIRDKGEDFTVFAADMADLTQSAALTVKAFSEQYRQLVGCLNEAISVNAAFVFEHGSTMSEISDRLGLHLTVINGHRLRLTARTGEHTGLTRQITARIGAAVAALQIGDITRQRIEHVEQSLAALDDFLGALPGEDHDAREGAIATICGLQAAQLEDMVAELDAKAGSLTNVLRQLAGDAETILRHGSEEAEQLLASGGTALGAIVGDLKETSALLGAFAIMRNDLDRLTGSVSDTVTAMVQQLEKVRCIEEDLRHLSLNTAIRCSRFGSSGRTLNVIAQELRMLTEQTDDATRIIISGLADAARLIGGSEDSGQAANFAVTELEADVRSALESLGMVTARMHEDADKIVQTGPSVMQSLDLAAAEVTVHIEMEKHMRAAAAHLERMRGGNPADPPPAFWPVTLLAEQRARYTMDSERRLHDRRFGSIAAVSEEAKATENTEQDGELADIFF